MESFKSNYWVLIKRAESVEGAWVAHCLDLDLITQGDSIVNAMRMVVEAVSMVVVDDLSQGLDPRTRPKAPEGCWKEFHSVTSHGDVFDYAKAMVNEDQIGCLVGQVCVDVERRQLTDTMPVQPHPHPFVWAQRLESMHRNDAGC